MAGIVLEVLVVGLLLYGLTLLGIAVITGAAQTSDRSDFDGPIFVTRRHRATATVATRRGRVRRLSG